MHTSSRIALVTLLLVLTSSLASTARAAPQSTHPAGVTELTITSDGARMPGLIYQAAGVGPHPTALFLHGYPGNERSLDVAQAARSAGWNSVYFNYRGAWGAEGDYSFIGSEADVQAVLHYLSNPENAAKLGVDPEQIALVGHSLGAHMAMAGLLDNPKVRCAVGYDGANLGAGGKGLFSDAAAEKLWSDYTDTLFMLNGWTGEKAVTEINKHGAQLDLEPRLATLGKRPVMMIAADSDVIPIDVHIKPLAERIRSIDSTLLEYHLIQDDHSFSSNRDKVIQLTLDFLDRRCRK